MIIYVLNLNVKFGSSSILFKNIRTTSTPLLGKGRVELTKLVAVPEPRMWACILMCLSNVSLSANVLGNSGLDLEGFLIFSLVGNFL